MRTRIVGCVVAVVSCAWVAGMAQAGTVIYVDAATAAKGDGSSWAKAYADIQDALTAAADANKPVEIRVAEGTYEPRLVDANASLGRARYAPFQLINGVSLKGGYAGSTRSNPDARDVEAYATILNHDPCSPPSRGNFTYVVSGSGTDSGAILDGFTITGGWAGGVTVVKGSPTVANCKFKSSYSASGGGNIVLTGCNFESALDAGNCNCVLSGCSFTTQGSLAVSLAGGTLTARNCAFTGNRGMAIECMSGNVDLTGCSFEANGASAVFGWNVTARGCKFVSNAGSAIGAIGGVVLVDCEFIGNRGNRAGAVEVWDQARVTATGCIFAGNSCRSDGTGGVIYANGSGIANISNCTFVGNRAGVGSIDVHPYYLKPRITRCIIWDDPKPFGKLESPASLSVTFCDVQGGWPGEGNIDVDPCFVAAGHWNLKNTPNDANDDVWVTGDYHLKSQAGHWDRSQEDWVYDDVTSLCIDAGDANSPVGAEPFPNGGYINLGAYGGTVEASRTYFGGPVCPAQMAGDINGDCKVDNIDKAILMQHWLMEGWEQVNQPPTVCLVSPQDGGELTAPTPIVLSVNASDPDGQVLRVSYSLRITFETKTPGGYSVISVGTGVASTDPSDGWKTQMDWSKISYDGVYTITAVVMDDEGARTTSAPITVTLHPSPAAQ